MKQKILMKFSVGSLVALCTGWIVFFTFGKCNQFKMILQMLEKI